MQEDPGEAHVALQKDFKLLYDKLVKDVGVELPPEAGGGGIGGDRG